MPTSIPFVTSSSDLVTTKEAQRDGFIEIALRRGAEANPYLRQGRALLADLKSRTRTCDDILKLAELRPALLLAAGFSVKAQGRMDDSDKVAGLEKFVKEVLAPTGRNYVEEIVYRYLLALGEQLGGHMRNIIGDAAREKLSWGIVSQLKIRSYPFSIYPNPKIGPKKWIDGDSCSRPTIDSAKAIRWEADGRTRMLIHNVDVPNVSKNVDIVVLCSASKNLEKKNLLPLLNDNRNFVVMGELKGGIDPAGADEHWKTARTALERIHASLKRVYIAFVGAAIEKAMAEEIFNMLGNGTLDYAANMTNAHQFESFCDWIVRQ